MRFRLLNHMYARAQGYFWLPCQLCGQHYGGHEWETNRYNGHFDSIPQKDGSNRGICPDCGQKAIDEAKKYTIVDPEGKAVKFVVEIPWSKFKYGD